MKRRNELTNIIIDSIVTWLNSNLVNLDEYKDLFSLENFPMWKTIMDIMFDNYEGNIQEILTTIIKNEKVFKKMINDVVGHRVLKIIIKKVFLKDELIEQRKIVTKYFESDK